MRNILFLFYVFMFVILCGCMSNRPTVKIEPSNIYEYTEMNVAFSKDSVRYGDTLDIRIEIKNISDSVICLFRDAVVWFGRIDDRRDEFITYYPSYYNLCYLAGTIEIKADRVSIRGEEIRPQESMVLNYQFTDWTNLVWKGNLYFHFCYRAFPSKYVVDKIKVYDVFLKVIH